MRITIFLALTLITYMPITTVGQIISYQNALPTFDQWIQESHTEFDSSSSIADRIPFFVNKQLGTAYGAGLLDQSSTEKLVCRLDSTDCVLFVENTLALAYSSAYQCQFTEMGKSNADIFKEMLTALRYREGKMQGYLSRLHYFSEWIYEHTNKNEVYREPIDLIGFELLYQNQSLPVLDKPTFMSDRPALYTRLKEDPQLIEGIKEMETRLSNQPLIHYIPEEKLVDFSDSLKTGDVIAFVSRVKGLDVSHTAIVSVAEKSDLENDNPAYLIKDIPPTKRKVSFWHASTKNGVELYASGLKEYLQKMKSVTGIVVLRLAS